MTKIRTAKIIPLLIMVVLSTQLAFAQQQKRHPDIIIGKDAVTEIINGIKDAIKRKSDCEYCNDKYHIGRAVTNIESTIQRLNNPKKKRKTTLREKLSKRMTAFSSNTAKETNGLISAIENGISDDKTSEKLNKLLIQIDSIIGLTEPLDFSGDAAVSTSLSVMKKTRSKIQIHFNSRNHEK